MSVVAVDFSTPLIPCLPDSSLRVLSRSCCLGRFLLLVITHISANLFGFCLSGHSVKVMQCSDALEIRKKIPQLVWVGQFTERGD